jgi:hypothetical protein
MTKNTRGIRNNNPFNIEHNAKNKWQGLDNPPVEPAGRFCRFKDPVYGIRAGARLIIKYFDDYDCDTVLKVFSRFAPSIENDVAAYARAVAFDIGCKPTDNIDLHDYKTLRAMVCGIIEHENGLKSYKEVYTDSQIDKALVLAGVQPAKKSLAKSRTVQGASVATVGVSLAAAESVEQLKTHIEPLVGYSDNMKVIFLLISLLGIALVFYARWSDRKRGIN